MSDQRSRISVLTVEDDAVHAYVLSRRLSSMGYDTINVESGLAALGVARFADAMICSVALPDMSALRLCAEIRQAHPHLPFVLTVFSQLSAQDRVALNDAGVSGWLQLPLESGELSSKLESLVRKSKHVKSTGLGF